MSQDSSLSLGTTLVPVSAKRTRQKQVKPDEDVWNWADSKIIGAFKIYSNYPRFLNISNTDESRKHWRSAVYSHYNVSLERCSETQTLTFRFTCRFDPTGHPSVTRARLATSHGTSNLDRGRKKCDKARGIKANPSNDPQQQPTPPYSFAKHRVLIAARCASSRRPFNSVADPHYIQEVELLRPGTKLPSPATVSRDLNKMYEFGAGAVREYFSVSFSFHSVGIGLIN